MKPSECLTWSVRLLDGIQRSPEQLAWCRRYSVYSRNPGQAALERTLCAWMDQVYEAGLVIANYREVMDRWGLEERRVAQADGRWLAHQPYLCVLASIAWHFRRDHFCEGSLISCSIASGALLRLFRRLQALCPTAAPAVTLAELLASRCACIPEEPGVYWVLAPEGMSIRFRERTFPGVRPYPAQLLRAKYEICARKDILYIGKAEGRGGLRQRLKQYMDYGQGRGSVHRGGRAVWQIEDFGLLLLAYETCPDPGAQERQLLRDYRIQSGTYPLANWRG